MDGIAAVVAGVGVGDGERRRAQHGGVAVAGLQRGGGHDEEGTGDPVSVSVAFSELVAAADSGEKVVAVVGESVVGDVSPVGGTDVARGRIDVHRVHHVFARQRHRVRGDGDERTAVVRGGDIKLDVGGVAGFIGGGDWLPVVVTGVPHLWCGADEH
ncbi:hypothetical protein, partial [Actinosynnema sp. ALI-1.44]|uniref:hypothetical protein n=1 Tax=Actinosynnema sp. ALI-1.44 TaxID=1933779 RepID=UPI001ED9F21B